MLSRIAAGFAPTVLAALPAVVLTVWSGPAGAAQAVLRLTPGLTLEAALKGGEVHRYEVDLAAGTHLGVTFDQQGADLRPVILGPDGATIYEYDFGEWGPEPAAIVAPADGRYVLEAHTVRADAPPGRYVLRVDAIRPATPDDEVRMRVMMVQIEAYAALRERPGGSLDRARALYQEALEAWRGLGERLAEAHTLTALGFIASSSDDIPTALAYSRAEISAWREAGSEYGEARAHRNLGITLRFLGEVDTVTEAYERSLAMHRAAGRRTSESLLLNDLARHHSGVGDLLTALDRAYEAVTLARDLGDPLLEAEALSSVGRIHVDLGEYEAALDVCRRARALAPDNEVVQGETAWRMGVALVELGQVENGQRQLEESLEIWTRRNWRGYQANVLVALGDLQVTQGAYTRAREHFARAATLAAETGFVWGEVVARRRLGDVLLRLGQIDAADAAFGDSAKLVERNPNPAAQAFASSDAARVHLARGDIAMARRHAEAAMRAVESARGRAETPRIRSALLASSQAIYETLIDVLMTEDEQEPDAGHAERALEVSERARARTLLELVLSSAADPAGADPVLMQDVRATQRRLNAKAQALDDARRRKDAAATETLSREIDELVGMLSVLDGRIRRETPGVALLVSPEPLTLARIQRDVLDDATVLVEYLLGEPHSYVWIVSQGGVTSRRLAPRSEIEAAARRFLEHVATPPARLDGGAPPRSDPGDVLSGLLLDSLRGVPSGRRLLVVAPGVLQNVPFAALPMPGTRGERVIAHHEVVYAPSASLVSALRAATAGRAAAPRALAVFADPVFDADDPRVSSRAGTLADAQVAAAPAAARLVRALSSTTSEARGTLSRLPFTRAEADAIAALAPPGSVLTATGFSANLRRVTDPSLADYRIVHFATHGLLDTRTPEISGLVFSLIDERGLPQEGVLRLHDMGRLRLNAELVVLSGCQTAVGREVAGEGAIGLTRGFMAAGARRIVASLWQVDDLATSELMTRFYRGMLERGLPAAGALRAAQQEMAASPRWSHPYFWAGLVAQGEWR
jgi:CHAT domain-containing protein/tetratricopeptide (TPR) repeat protein